MVDLWWWLVAGLWMLSGFAVVAILPRHPTPRKPHPNLRHEWAGCRGLWLENYGEPLLGCVRCGSQVEGTPENVERAKHENVAEAFLRTIEEDGRPKWAA